MTSIEVVDYDDGAKAPTVSQVFGGRLMSSDFKPMDDGKEKVSLHVVHVDLIMDTKQKIAFLQAMDRGEPITVQLVNQ